MVVPHKEKVDKKNHFGKRLSKTMPEECRLAN
jgi:hypothetical protein